MHNTQNQKPFNILLTAALIASTVIAAVLIDRDASPAATVQAAPSVHRPAILAPHAIAINAPQSQTTSTSTCLSLRGYECLDAVVTVGTCPGNPSGCISGTLTLTDVMNIGKLVHKPVSDTLFAVDIGPYLDKYLFGGALLNGVPLPTFQ